jgi:hypothetical protein
MSARVVFSGNCQYIAQDFVCQFGSKKVATMHAALWGKLVNVSPDNRTAISGSSYYRQNIIPE